VKSAAGACNSPLFLAPSHLPTCSPHSLPFHAHLQNRLYPRWQQLVCRDAATGAPDPRGEVWAAPYRWGATLVAYRKDRLGRWVAAAAALQRYCRGAVRVRRQQASTCCCLGVGHQSSCSAVLCCRWAPCFLGGVRTLGTCSCVSVQAGLAGLLRALPAGGASLASATGPTCWHHTCGAGWRSSTPPGGAGQGWASAGTFAYR